MLGELTCECVLTDSEMCGCREIGSRMQMHDQNTFCMSVDEAVVMGHSDNGANDWPGSEMRWPIKCKSSKGNSGGLALLG